MRKLASMAVLATLAACGGSGDGDTADDTITLKAGQSVVLKTGQVAHVPAGTTVTSGASQITINGDNNTVDAAVGAVVQVSSSAVGPADNIVTATTTTPATANVAVLAGSSTTNEHPADGTGAAAIFWGGGQIAVDPRGDLMVSDQGKLRRVTAGGVVTTLAQDSPIAWQGMGIDAQGDVFSLGGLTTGGNPLYEGAVAEYTAAGQASVFASGLDAGGLNGGFGAVAVDPSGHVYVADAALDQVLKLTPSGTASVLAGNGQTGNVDGSGAAASLVIGVESGMPIDGAGNLYLLSGDAIRKIDPQGVVTTLVSGLAMGVVQPTNGGVLARDAAGNFYTGISKTIYRITAGGVVSNYADLGTIDFITALTTDAAGNLYVGTRGLGAEIFKVSPP